MGSKEFIIAKKLIYEKKFEIEKVNLKIIGPANKDKRRKSRATISFKKDDKKRTLSSTKPDFIMLAGCINTTYKDGKKKLIEIKDSNRYYSNLELLGTKDEFKDTFKDAIEKIRKGEANIPQDFSLQESFSDLIKNDFNKESVKKLLLDYPYVLAFQFIVLQELHSTFEIVKKSKLIFDMQRFETLMKQTDTIFHKSLIKLHPFESMKKFLSLSMLDYELQTKNLPFIEKTSQDLWRNLSKAGNGKIEGRLAARQMVQDYNAYFEILKKFLRDLAIFINYSSNDFEKVGTFYEIETILKRNGYADLVTLIIAELRQSGIHWDIDYTQKGKVLLYDTRTKNRKLVLDISYEKLMDKTKKLKDLTWAVFFSYCMWRELIFFRCLDDPELKFLLVENIKP